MSGVLRRVIIRDDSSLHSYYLLCGALCRVPYSAYGAGGSFLHRFLSYVVLFVLRVLARLGRFPVRYLVVFTTPSVSIARGFSFVPLGPIVRFRLS